ncbi:MAG: hypothetical protein HZA25_02935 [Candidatus Niyogibacteria bacterium]|nr:hypothetical protein [Candidatus Niyogibacteria bacterium]
MNEEQKNDVAPATEPPISEEQWLAERNRVLDEMGKRAAEREPRIVALESRIGALLKNRPEPRKVEVEEGEYANYEVAVTPATKVGDSSFVPIDGL